MKPRRTLYAFGRQGDRVRVLVDTNRQRVEVLYRDIDGLRRKRVWADDKQGREEAIAWADTFKVERERMRRDGEQPKPISVRALWTAYVNSPDWSNLRPASQVSYRDRWGKWETFLGRETPAGTITLTDIDRFIATARTAGMAINQVRQALNVTRIVYRWGQARRLIATNDFGLYRWKQPRDATVLQPGQYTGREFEKLIAQSEPQHSQRWRIHVALLVMGASGQRANAIRHLRWQDIDAAKAVVTWPAPWQKQGKALVRRLTWDFVAALETARFWRERGGLGRVRKDRKAASRPAQLKKADWVLFAQNRKAVPVSYSSLHTLLRELELAAKVKHEPFRAFHGTRRKVVTDVIRATGDRMLGLEYVGDSDLKMLASYDKGMDERLDSASAALDRK